MILPDVNLLIHAYDSGAAFHAPARRWWEEALSGTESVGLAWATILGFIRLTTSRAVMTNPWPADAAVERVEEWLAQPNVRVAHPGERHAALLFGLLRALGTAANLTTDAHLAALAIEHGYTLYSLDADFGRFKRLKWRNPLSQPRRGTP